MDVVRRNVLAPGGKVEIHSERGRGARVTIMLSLAVELSLDLPGIVRASAKQQAALRGRNGSNTDSG
jgi:hypothetical protein